MIIEHSDSLWGQRIFPYTRVDQKANIQGRLYEADSTIISFEEVITIKEKKKKKKKKKEPKVKKPKKKKTKKKRKKRKEKIQEEEEEWGSLAEMNGETEEEKVEEVVEKVEEEKPQVPVEEVQEEVTDENDDDDAPVAPEEEEVVVKRKITKDYFVKIKTILKKEDGTTEEKIFTYPVKGIEEREDATAKKDEERFQLTIKSKGKKELYLYLYGDRTVSSMEVNGVKYLMRGH